MLVIIFVGVLLAKVLKCKKPSLSEEETLISTFGYPHIDSSVELLMV